VPLLFGSSSPLAAYQMQKKCIRYNSADAREPTNRRRSAKTAHTTRRTDTPWLPRAGGLNCRWGLGGGSAL